MNMLHFETIFTANKMMIWTGIFTNKLPGEVNNNLHSHIMNLSLAYSRCFLGAVIRECQSSILIEIAFLFCPWKIYVVRGAVIECIQILSLSFLLIVIYIRLNQAIYLQKGRQNSSTRHSNFCRRSEHHSVNSSFIAVINFLCNISLKFSIDCFRR